MYILIQNIIAKTFHFIHILISNTLSSITKFCLKTWIHTAQPKTVKMSEHNLVNQKFLSSGKIYEYYIWILLLNRMRKRLFAVRQYNIHWIPFFLIFPCLNHAAGVMGLGHAVDVREGVRKEMVNIVASWSNIWYSLITRIGTMSSLIPAEHLKQF